MPIRVLTATLINTISNGGRQIAIKFAKETETWHRTALAPEIQTQFVKAMEKADIPARATTAIMAETEHPSQKDAYPHFTVIYEDDQGNHITTKHVYP